MNRAALNDPSTAEAVKIIKDHRAGSAGVPAWPRREGPTVSSSGSGICSWLDSARAGGDACGTRTMVFDYFHSFYRGGFRFLPSLRFVDTKSSACHQ